MTRKQVSRCCVFAIVLGLIIGVVAEYVLLLAGIERPPFFKSACTAACVAVCLACRFVHERIAERDYEKLAEARRKRMHW